MSNTITACAPASICAFRYAVTAWALTDRIWCSRSAGEDLVEPKPDRNVISLSEAFWQEIQAHPIPIDAGVVRQLTSIPGCLDLYMWLCWRCHQVKGEQVVPLFGEFGLANQLGVAEYTRDRNFRKRIREWLRLVRLYWPECPAKLDDEGQSLQLTEGQAIAPAVASAQFNRSSRQGHHD